MRRPFGDLNPASLPSCYSEELNNELIAACRTRSPECNPERIARALELPFCDGGGGSTPPARPAKLATTGDTSLSWYAVTFLAGAFVGAYVMSATSFRRSQRA